MRYLTLIASALLATALPVTARSETEIHYGCIGNAWEACFWLMEGDIEPGLTERFRAAYGEGADGNKLFLDSPGGNLGEAIKLGRLVRELNLNTRIGGSGGFPRNPDGSLRIAGGDFPADGRCESACAYVFMGGLERFLNDGTKLGLHRFHAPGQSIDAGSAQVISGQLISYMVEMGIDARLFVLAADQDQNSMYYVTRQDALDYDLITEEGFGPFFLEPYGKGVVAAARRLDPPSAYDSATQITFFCRGGEPQAMIRAQGGWLEPLDARPELEVTLDGADLSGQGRAQIRSDDTSDYITATLSPAAAKALANARDARLVFPFARASGWGCGAVLSLSDMDRAMIKSAFTHCIG